MILLSTEFIKSATLPSGYQETRLANGLNPVSMKLVPDGRIFLCEKNGVIRVIKNNVMLFTPLISIDNVDVFEERGLQSIAIDPDFATNGYIYAYYTEKGTTNSSARPTTNSRNRICRFTVNGDVADLSTKTLIFQIDPLGNIGWHNGGGLVFGLDNKLYISTGENTITSYSQTTANLLGKVLRINSDGTIPSDNPYFNISSVAGLNKAIYALGFRNPFHLGIQPGTGRIFLNDVGAGSFEEINDLEAGKNYGWPTIEGKKTSQTAPANYKDPLYAYDHSGGQCSITAGIFYNPVNNQFPSSLTGKFFFGDYCAGYIRILDGDVSTVTGFATNINRPLAFLVDQFGAFYYIARGGLAGGSTAANTSSDNGELWKVQYTGSGAVSFAVQPESQSVSAGAPADFITSVNGNLPIHFQWYKNNTIIQGANASLYTLTTTSISDNGNQYKLVISNYINTITSNIAVLTVFPNTLPQVVITSPDQDYSYSGGDVLSFSGSAIDAEDGTLPGSAFSWKVDFHHDVHFHPAMSVTSGAKSGTYPISNSGEVSDNVWYRIHLTVTDNVNARSSIYKDIYPNKVSITLNSTPAGLNLKLDGVTISTPYKFTAVAGIIREIEADSQQTLNNKGLYFQYWSNDKSRKYTLTPIMNETITAVYLSTPLPTDVVAEFDAAKSPVIYPNPNENGQFFIDLRPDKLNCVVVINSMGEKIIEGNNLKVLNLEEFAKGLYLVKIFQKEKVDIVKLHYK